MRFSFLTLFPEMIEQATQFGILGQAVRNKKLEIDCVNPRDFTEDVHKTVDDKPYGGSDGMLMLYTPMQAAMESMKNTISENKLTKVIHLSPQGQVLNDRKALELAELDHIVWVCSRYAGVDQRFINNYVDEELSLGDYVISGGELAALVATDAVSRKLPGILGNSQSALRESFAKDGLLEPPQFTRPAEVGGQLVPEVLTSGHHKNIQAWERALSLIRTLILRPDLLASANPTLNDWELALGVYKDLSAEERKSCGLSIDRDLEALITEQMKGS